MSSNVDMTLVNQLEDKSYKIRKDLLNFVYHIGMGHLGGELSIVEMAVALYYKYMNYDPKNPKWEDRDRLVLSKGHCGETLYCIYSDLGMYTMDYMIEHFESLDTAVFGQHPNRKYIPAIEVSCGSLGHGLPIAVGLALGARMQKANWRTFVIVGDGELQEGTNWEAAAFAAHNHLDNLVAILDENTLQINGRTSEICKPTSYESRYAAFGWAVRPVPGHDVGALYDAFAQIPLEPGKPTLLVAKTTKGKGISFLEDQQKYHHWNPDAGEAARALEELDARAAERGW